MDINSLLSPQDSPVAEGTTPKASTPKTGPDVLRRDHSSSIPPKTASSPLSQPALSALPPPTIPHNAVVQAQQLAPSPPTVSPGNPRPASVTSTPSADGKANLARQPSTPGMDTLADLASMQHHQQAARVSANGLRSSEVYDAPQSSNAPTYPSVHTRPRTRSTPRTSFDMTMADAASQTPPPRNYKATSLSESDQQKVPQLASYLTENTYAYASHVELIQLLHLALISYMRQATVQPVSTDSHTYELLLDLRQAREAMDARFPVGEDLWVDWISDERMLATTIDGKVEVMELCRRAVEEEVGSSRLWLLYGNWMSSLYAATHDDAPLSMCVSVEAETQTWTEEERVVGAELFGWDVVLDVWQRAARATQWRLNDSHLLWDRYAAILLEELAQSPNEQKIEQLKALFFERLQIPHDTWDQTFQTFSTFVTTYGDKATYEETMVNTNKRAAQAKSLYDAREMYEMSVQKAVDSKDPVAEWAAVSKYLEWEVSQMGKQKGAFALCNALYERAVLRFASDAKLWEDYVYLVLERATPEDDDVSVLSVLHRATRHCPWSGTLWSQYLLSSEGENRPFQDVEDVKHKATATGLMDIGGMEEVLKVHTAWCGYLNRRAFHDRATDEEADVAEVGIRSALESVRELGEKKYGRGYQGDPTYRLERIYIEYLSHGGLWNRARKEVWQALIPRRGDSYEFWLRWYQWEMICWSRLSAGSRANGAGSDQPLPTAVEAMSVLRQALKRKNLDWPEKILEVYIQHAEDREKVKDVQHAVILARRVGTGVAKRRQREAAEAFREEQEAALAAPADETLGGNKRKRESEPDASFDDANKKPRSDDPTTDARRAEDTRPSEPSLPKRDRENTTVIVKNLPKDAKETKVRQFFRDVSNES